MCQWGYTIFLKKDTTPRFASPRARFRAVFTRGDGLVCQPGRRCVWHTLRPMSHSSPQLAAVLNLGCGRKRREGAVNVDCTTRTSPDVVHDLNVRPWPFPNDAFAEVFAFDVLEHLEDVVAAMEELHRVCRNGARVEITVPHFSSANAFTDPDPPALLQSLQLRLLRRRTRLRLLFSRQLPGRSRSRDFRQGPGESDRRPSGQSIPARLRAPVGVDVSRVVHFGGTEGRQVAASRCRGSASVRAMCVLRRRSAIAGRLHG